MNTNNRPRHYKKRKNKIAETYLIRMNESEKEKIHYKNALHRIEIQMQSAI